MGWGGLWFVEFRGGLFLFVGSSRFEVLFWFGRLVCLSVWSDRTNVFDGSQL